MNVMPLKDRIIIRIIAADKKSTGGLFIPETAQEKTQIGFVEEIGNDKEVIDVKVGQKVLYDKFAGVSITEDRVEYLIIRMRDILGVFK